MARQTIITYKWQGEDRSLLSFLFTKLVQLTALA